MCASADWVLSCGGLVKVDVGNEEADHGFMEDADIHDPEQCEEPEEDQIFSPFYLATTTSPSREKYGYNCRS